MSEAIALPRVASIAARGIRFLAAGGLVACLYLAVTTLLASVIGVPFQAALAIGFAAALTSHFLLQRVFVWRHTAGYALTAREQVGRYVPLAGAQYGITAASTAFLPGAIGVGVVYVYLATAATLTCANFFVVGARVFHHLEAGTRQGPA